MSPGLLPGLAGCGKTLVWNRFGEGMSLLVPAKPCTLSFRAALAVRNLFSRVFRNLLPEILFGTSAQLKTQIHHLTDMMVKMSSTA